jgi:acyl-CoA thioester hydrolase
MLSAMEHRLTLQLRWTELDVLGHLNQAVYHELLEEARRGLLTGMIEGEFVLARVELDYRREVRITDSPVEAVAGIARIGTKSFTIEHAILVGGEVAAEGIAVCVAWDGAARTSRAFTEAERRALSA